MEHQLLTYDDLVRISEETKADLESSRWFDKYSCLVIDRSLSIWREVPETRVGDDEDKPVPARRIQDEDWWAGWSFPVISQEFYLPLPLPVGLSEHAARRIIISECCNLIQEAISGNR